MKMPDLASPLCVGCPSAEKLVYEEFSRFALLPQRHNEDITKRCKNVMNALIKMHKYENWIKLRVEDFGLCVWGQAQSEKSRC